MMSKLYCQQGMTDSCTSHCEDTRRCLLYKANVLEEPTKITPSPNKSVSVDR